MYLAQNPMMRREKEGAPPPPLSALLASGDIPAAPPCVAASRITQLNFWLSVSATRSSLHYDSYQNLLVILAGEKRVDLWPPSAILPTGAAETAALRSSPLYGDAPNHAATSEAGAPLASGAGAPPSSSPPSSPLPPAAYSARLGPGDALFLPEGWWHAVASAELTVAVNYWWNSRWAEGLGAA